MRTIIVEPYNPKWAEEFERIKSELLCFIGDSVIAVEHVGSTSVVGLWAKPIIDIDVIIDDGMMPVVIDKLAQFGYVHRGDLGVKGREAFGYDRNAKAHLMEHHLYVCHKDNAELRQHLALRSFLRNSPEYREKYSNIKREMAKQFPHDIDSYLKGKEPVIMEIYRLCGIDPWQKQVDREIPPEAARAIEVIKELLEGTLVAVYLYGSAAVGGLHKDSDVDLLVVADRALTVSIRRELTERLMLISGRVGNGQGTKPLEVTVVNWHDVVPWRYPPKQEFLYGEWLRDLFEAGEIPAPVYNPDLAVLLAQVRNSGISLYGPEAAAVLAPVPLSDIRKAIRDSLPGLIAGLKGDERNVVLTLARMWLTAATGEISAKDHAAEWAAERLPKNQAELVDMARQAYLGKAVDKWEGLDASLTELVGKMQQAIEALLNGC